MYPAKNIPGVKTATKTGTSDKGGNAKDLWMFSYSPALTMGVWLGNPDTTILKNGTSSLGSPIVASVMEYAHKEVYAKENKWKSGDWFAQPQGIQRVGGEVYPSWWNKSQGQSNATITFDKLSRKRATECTPEGAKISVDVIKTTDPVTKRDAYGGVPLGYDATKNDDRHSCNDDPPSISGVDISSGPGDTWEIEFDVSSGTFTVDDVSVTANGTNLTVKRQGGGYSATYSGEDSPEGNVSIRVTDTGYYSTSGSY
jgi:penicillin-binding protein 1A